MKMTDDDKDGKIIKDILIKDLGLIECVNIFTQIKKCYSKTLA